MAAELQEQLQRRRSIVDTGSPTFMKSEESSSPKEPIESPVRERAGRRSLTERPGTSSFQDMMDRRKNEVDSTAEVFQGAFQSAAQKVVVNVDGRTLECNLSSCRANSGVSNYAAGSNEGRGQRGTQCDGEDEDFTEVLAKRKVALDMTAKSFENTPEFSHTDFVHTKLPPSPVRGRSPSKGKPSWLAELALGLSAVDNHISWRFVLEHPLPRKVDSPTFYIHGEPAKFCLYPSGLAKRNKNGCCSLLLRRSRPYSNVTSVSLMVDAISCQDSTKVRRAPTRPWKGPVMEEGFDLAEHHAEPFVMCCGLTYTGCNSDDSLTTSEYANFEEQSPCGILTDDMLNDVDYDSCAECFLPIW